MKILVIDDSALMRRELSRMLEALPGADVRTARDGADGLALVREFDPDVVTLDINMPQMDGLTCLSHIMTEAPRPVIMVSSLTSEGALATFEALELGAVDFIEKPGGTVSVNARQIEGELCRKVAAFARDRTRLTQLRSRMARPASARPASARPSAETRPQPRPGPANGQPVPGLVVIGSSTGGPSALETVLRGLHPGFDMPVVIAQHIPERFSQTLADRLDRLLPQKVAEVTRSVPVRRGEIYIGRGGADVRVVRRGGDMLVQAVPASGRSLWTPSVDLLARSATAILPPERIVAVLLTGMGDDGADGMAELHRLGGTTIAEAEETAVVWGMPGALVKRGGAGSVLPLGMIGAEVSRRCSAFA